jgi:cyclophilin family peptidyl-prolyl cis-trans isomerase
MKCFWRFFWLLVLTGSVTAGTVVQFRSTVGDVDVELYDTEKPVTVENFLRYVVSGTYANSFFHRAVHDFVIQGGGFGVANKGSNDASIVVLANRSPITNEFSVGPLLTNGPGTIAMAKTSDPNSATSQFFFNLTNNPSLDITTNSGGFTVFGRVVSGAETLTAWNSFFIGPPTNQNLIVNGGGAFSQLPVLKLRTNEVGGFFIALADLVYFDVTLLRVKVTRQPDGRAQIQWLQVAGRTNTVEYTTQFPPQWQVLSNVPPAAVGNGVVVDPTPDPTRFYRVRATY